MRISELITGYTYHISGAYNMTKAILRDGRSISIDGQYGTAKVIATEPEDDYELTGDDLSAVLTDARQRGVWGRKPMTSRAVMPDPVDYGMDA